MVGPTASVLHYTYVSRIKASLDFRLLGIFTVGTIEDFGAQFRSELLGEAKIAFRALCRAIGFVLTPGGEPTRASRLPFWGYKARPLAFQRHPSKDFATLRDGL